ncbi:MAG TPA: hypothetical protein DCL21_01635 [Alphaproteobacteria bacterium]|nr:hypothetical protein [Alphaproteobacteria bacterium]
MEEIDYSKYCNIDDKFSFNVDGKDFTCKELSLIEEGEFQNYYLTENLTYNMVKFRLVQLTQLTQCPFTSDWINYMFKTYHPEYKLKSNVWDNMSSNERLMFLEKLSDEYIGKLIKPVTKHYSNKEVAVKNS